jgi:hypothetical protein
VHQSGAVAAVLWMHAAPEGAPLSAPPRLAFESGTDDRPSPVCASEVNLLHLVVVCDRRATHRPTHTLIGAHTPHDTRAPTPRRTVTDTLPLQIRVQLQLDPALQLGSLCTPAASPANTRVCIALHGSPQSQACVDPCEQPATLPPVHFTLSALPRGWSALTATHVAGASAAPRPLGVPPTPLARASNLYHVFVVGGAGTLHGPKSETPPLPRSRLPQLQLASLAAEPAAAGGTSPRSQETEVEVKGEGEVVAEGAGTGAGAGAGVGAGAAHMPPTAGGRERGCSGGGYGTVSTLTPLWRRSHFSAAAQGSAGVLTVLGVVEQQ